MSMLWNFSKQVKSRPFTTPIAFKGRWFWIFFCLRLKWHSKFCWSVPTFSDYSQKITETTLKAQSTKSAWHSSLFSRSRTNVEVNLGWSCRCLQCLWLHLESNLYTAQQASHLSEGETHLMRPGSANDCDQVSTWQTALSCICWFIYTHMWEENLALPNLQNIHKLLFRNVLATEPLNLRADWYCQLRSVFWSFSDNKS
jgi:hypothetical protein